MANNILLKKSSVAAKVPTTGDLDYGELALNYADGALYYKTSGNTIARLNPLEADTLATVTGRGATTSTSVTLSGDPGVAITANSSIGRMLFSKTGATTQIWQIGTSGNDATARGFNIDDYTGGATRFRIAHTTGDISLNAATFVSGDLSLTSATPVLKTDGSSRELVIQSAGVNGRMTFSAGGINWLGATGQAYSGVYIGGNTSTNQLTINQSTNSASFGSGLVLSIANTSASTTTSSGALIVSGGVGVAGAINAGGAVTTTGLTVNGASSLAGDVTNVDSISFDLTAAEATGIGKLYWDAGVGELRYGLGGGNVDLAIGQMQVTYVRNAETSTITKGQVVYLFGAQGDRPSVKLASNTSDTTSNKTFGIAAENIAANGDGYIVNVGTITGIDTSMYSPGDILWLGSTAGTFTTTKAVAPNHLVFIGVVQKANQGGGQIYVRVQNGYELDEIHDVLISGIGLNHSLFYDTSVNVWKNYAPSAARTNLGLGTIATQNANSVAITGGAIDGTPIGATTPSTGKFTTLQTTGDATIGGNLTVSGTTTTVNAQNLNITDNLFYLNAGSTNTNPDIGFAANYNDGTYRHAGFFRDATDGYWKVFKNYTPEPDASIYIDTSHASFALADIQAANFRGALVGNATTATTLAGTPTINGVTFNGGSNITITANTTNTLTIGDGLSGTSFNGSAAVTIAADSTIARRADVHYVGTTSIALNRASAAQSLTGIDGITGGTTGVAINAGGSNQNITLTPTGIAGVTLQSNGNNGDILLKLRGTNSTPNGTIRWQTSTDTYTVGIGSRFNISDNGLEFLINGNTTAGSFRSSGNFLVGTNTETANAGKIQLASHTTTSGGIGFGDIVLHRASAGKIRLAPPEGGSGTVAFELYNASGNAFRMLYGYPYAPVLYADDALTVTSAAGSITFKSNNTTTLTLDTSNGGTLVGNLTVQGTGNSSIAGNLGIGTTSPGQIVEASRSQDTDTAIKVTNANTGASATAQFFASNGTNQTQFYHTGTAYGGVGAITANQGGIYTTSAAGLAIVANNAAGLIKFVTGGTAEKVRIDASGNVGIGTTSPSQKLDVSGNIALSTGGYIYGDTTTPYLRLNQTNGTFLGYSANSVLSLLGSVTTLSAGSNYLGLITNGSERMRITSTGNVGIGATAPSSPLEIRSGSNARLTINRSGAWGVSPGDIKFNTDDAGTDYWTFGMVADSTNNIRLKYNASEYLTILTNGNVGIGTASPSEKLAVSGGNISLTYNSNNPNVRVIDGTIITKLQSQSVGDTAGAIGTESNHTLKLITNNAARVTIDTGGSVGIGVSPSYTLDVAGTFRTDRSSTGTVARLQASGITAGQQANLFLGKSDTNNNEATFVWHHVGDGSTSNYLGIGTFGTDDVLNVFAGNRVGIATTASVGNTTLTASLGIAAYSNTAGVSPYLQTYNGNATLNEKTWRMGGQANGKFQIETVNDAYSSASTKVIISQTGNVGIGVEPTEKLHVAGAARITGILYDSAYNAGTNGQVLTSTGTGTAWSSTGVAVSGNGNTNYVAKWSSSTGLTDSGIYETADGKVSIGVGANPTQKLEISGNFGWGSEHVLSYSALTTNSTTANQVITSVSATTYRTFKFIIQAVDATAGKYQSQEIMAIHNGSTVAHTEYTAINVGGAVATYDVDISGGTVRLLCTPLSANSTVFKVSMQLIKV